uniref:DNA-directed DNA polymerase n=1 Tax=Myxobolus squamalis TaxID=59785 RepID=A0A6B2G1H4_MYXSQ
MAEYVSNLNPQPVKLKFEKVYHPCFLQSKKRYVGYMFSNEGQILPKFDSKGIETIRRDFCPLASKALKKCLKVLFDTKDISKVKEKFQKICTNLNCANIRLNDLFLSKIYRGYDSYKHDRNPLTEIIKNNVLRDPNYEPNVGDRVPYVIVSGSPKSVLASLAKSRISDK